MPKKGNKRLTPEPSRPAKGVIREAAAAYTAAQPGKEKPVRKNFYLNQSKIDMARKLIAAKTETEAVDVALDMLICGEVLARGTESMVGQDYHDVLGIAGEVPAKKRAG